MGGEPGALGAERLLDDLDENLLAFFEEVFDSRLCVGVLSSASFGTLRADGPAAARLVFARFELVEFFERVDDVGDVQEAVALEAARLAKDRLGSYLVLGVLASFTFQVVYNITMSAGLAPVKGLTLPLMSYGGSSMIATLAGFGLILNVRMRRFTN